jgi:hypothetical protein
MRVIRKAEHIGKMSFFRTQYSTSQDGRSPLSWGLLSQIQAQLGVSKGPRVIVDASRIADLRAGGDSWSQIQAKLGVSKGTAQRAFAGCPKLSSRILGG